MSAARTRSDVQLAPIRDVVLQPTRGCNLNCAYCYLPNRVDHRVMPLEVAHSVARWVEQHAHPVNLLWHAGEPLSCGRQRFAELLDVFEPLRRRGCVQHSLQTNATLIDAEWCNVFVAYGIEIGVSIDGPRALNVRRVNWSGRASFDQTMAGIESLKLAGVPFSAIAVVTEEALSCAELLYDFMTKLGCASCAFNIVEQEGVQFRPTPDDERVQQFWKALYEAWRRNPVVQVRDIRNALVWFSAVVERRIPEATIELWPTVCANGDVVVLSPEFAGFTHPEYELVIGNVLAETLDSIIMRASSATYLRDFFIGVAACQQTCDYFSFCLGGQASNKLFERGSLRVTETAFCRNTKMRLVDALIESL